MSFFCTFQGLPGTTWVILVAFSGHPGTTWVILVAFSLKFSGKSFFVLFRLTQARPRVTQARPGSS
ncbi:hypothetical protein T11_7560 [Trichinella zimbabwensis]|uniref:Uncharacterized protein n=1 Tax=Trichinella zimbabwensis TaxID=268475 RepID=A0A0V1GFU5_9BILA|nr:hypothetical protein T11_7560 [Trichinella zimbabwensis]